MTMTSMLVLYIVCSTRITLTWDSQLLQPSNERYMFEGALHGMDVFTDDLNGATGPETFMEKFYVCYEPDGSRTYYKKFDESHFSNRRFWVITAQGHFVASMKTC